MKKLSQYFPNVEVLPAYQPAMMQYDGSTGYYTTSSTISASNKQTAVLRFSASAPWANNRILAYNLKSGEYTPLLIAIVESDNASGNANKLWARVIDNANNVVCQFFTPFTVTDGKIYNVFFDYDGDNGTANFLVNGTNADDTGATGRVAPTTGTLDSGATCYFSVGSTFSGTTLGPCNIGFCGYSRTAGLSNADFFDSSNNPIKQDEATWSNSGWGAQPLYWNEHGEMSNNKGSAGNMTETGTIVVADQNSTFFQLVEK